MLPAPGHSVTSRSQRFHDFSRCCQASLTDFVVVSRQSLKQSRDIRREGPIRIVPRKKVNPRSHTLHRTNLDENFIILLFGDRKMHFTLRLTRKLDIDRNVRKMSMVASRAGALRLRMLKSFIDIIPNDSLIILRIDPQYRTNAVLTTRFFRLSKIHPIKNTLVAHRCRSLEALKHRNVISAS
jgi:hypothetical protein